MKSNKKLALIAITALLLVSCGGGGSSRLSGTPPSNNAGTTDLSTDPDNDDSYNDVQPVNPSATYANIIKGCVTAEYTNQLCTLEELPLLGMEKPTPTVADVMDRVLVSDAWMADRFATLLASYPAEFLTLFKGLTAVVIDDDIRPAHYWSATGAIYIDPAYLWVTNAEKKTINVKQDYRAGFDDLLSFTSTYRYLTADGTRAGNWGSLTDTNNRTLADAQFFTARLLIHELAHVNDFLPYDSYDSLNRNQWVGDATDSLTEGRISDQLTAWRPLQSSVWAGLGQVMFQGQTANSQQQALTAAQVGYEFEQDSAADDYAYSSQFEDLAMLFEIAMMKYFFNLDYQLAFLTHETANPQYCSDYSVGWGAVGWIGDTDVKERAQFVTSALMPAVDMDLFYQNLQGPQLMMTGSAWCFPSTSAEGSQKPQLQQRIPEDDFRLRRGF